MIMHSDFDLDAGLHNREFAGKRCDQFRNRLERIHYFFAPRDRSRSRLIVQEGA
jgi:hypothetical protein